MRRAVLMITTLACLLTCAGAAAEDESRDEFAPELYVRFSFGASAPAPPAASTLQARDIALQEAGVESAGVSTTTWVVIGVAAAAVIVAVAAHNRGGDSGGGGGSY